MSRLPIRLPSAVAAMPSSVARALVAVAAVLGALLLTWVTTWLLVGDGVPRGTRVLGVDIGGMAPAAAEKRLESELAERAQAPLEVTAGDHTATLRPRKAGLGLDAGATVAQATERPAGPVALVRLLVDPPPVAPVVAVDEKTLTARLTKVAKQADRAPQNGGVRFADGRAKAVEPEGGAVVDPDASRRAVRDAYLRRESVTLPTETKTPAVSADEVERAMREFAEPAMAGSISLDIGEGTLVLTPTDLDDHLSMKPDDQDRLVPRVSGKGLRKEHADRLQGFEKKAEDASFRIADGTPQVVPATLGRRAKPADLGKAVLEALRREDRSARLELTTAKPDLTTEKAQSLGVDEQLSTYTTSYPYAEYRLTNIHRAADLADETLLLPGETFSMNDTVGERTEENGFAKGTIIKDGRFFEAYGGGVSQLATTTFNAAFFAGLEDVEHKPHSFYISRYPEGREATLVWPVVDLKFRNDSENGVLVDTSYTDSTVTVTLWGTKRYEIEARKGERYNVKPFEKVRDDSKECVDQTGVKGFDVKVFRDFIRDGEKVRTETFKTHYNPAAEITCEEPKGKGADGGSGSSGD